LMHAAYRAAIPAAAPYRAGVLDQTRELDCLAQAVYYEARGETPAGQAAVAQVVLNRVRHPAFPKSICAVVFQGAQTGRGCQFSFACNGSMRNGHEAGAWDRAKRIASRAFDGQVMADVGNATHFHVVSVAPNWAGLMKVAQIGTHIFYRFGGRAGAPQAFNLQPHLIETLIEPAVAGANQPQLILASALTVIEPVKGEAAAATPAVKSEPAKVEPAKTEAAKAEPAPAKAATPKPEAAAAKVEASATSTAS
jgi:hypothetical protein